MRLPSILAALPLAAAAPLVERADGQDGQDNNYIVVLKNDAEKPALQAVSRLPAMGANVRIAAGAAINSIQKELVYDFGKFKAFHAMVDGTQLAALKGDPSVDYVVPNGRAKILPVGELPKPQSISRRAVVAEESTSWGLARISHRKTGSAQYIYDSSAGEGTCAYVLDTGIEVEHPEFEGRAVFLKNLVSNATTDDLGHGTHCAATIGGKTYGVTKKTKLFGVKVLDEFGGAEWSTVISGIEFAAKHAQTADCPKGAVLSMSLGGPTNQAVNDAVAAAVDTGLFVAVAAGNEAADAKTSSPSSEPKAFTVGASDRSDKMADFSNYGSLVDIFAPGVDIKSAWINGTSEIQNGTSMATPYVAGLAAYILGLDGKVSPSQLTDKIKALGTKNTLTGRLPAGTVNLEAYNGAEDSTPAAGGSSVRDGFIDLTSLT